MNWILSLLVALITGVIGLFSAGFVAGAYASWYHVSTREGAAGYFVMGMAILGALVSFIAGLVMARLVAGGAAPGFGKAMLCSSGVVLGMAALVLLICRLLADIPPTLEGRELRLEAEIRLPAGHAQPQGEGTFELGSMVNHRRRAVKTGELKVVQARQEGGRWVIPAEVLLFTSRGQRTIQARLGGEDIAGFIVPLPGHPGARHEQWSGWLPQPRTGAPWPDAKSSYRFRVQRIAPPPPPPTQEEIGARQEVQQQAEFDALPADAPLATWLPYTRYGAEEKRCDAAVRRMLARPDFTGELFTLMVDADPRRAEDALRLVERLPEPGPELLPGVAAAGRDLIGRIRKVNATTPEQDPGYEAAADASIRFNAWMSAVRTLRGKAGGDFTPELGEILELSRIRTDSRVMQEGIRRVASFYLKEWAGVEPRPDDPPPK